MTAGTSQPPRSRAGSVARIAIRAALRTPARPFVVRAIQRACRRRPWSRSREAAAWYAGEFLAERDVVLRGSVPTGSAIHLRARDHAHRHLYFHGEPEPATTRLLVASARPGWSFADVGANVGYYTLLAADLGGAAATVHAFEPNPELLRLLARSTEGVAADVTLVAKACADAAGRAELHLSPEPTNSGLSSLRRDVFPATSEVEAITVDLVRLDDHCAEHGLAPDVVKVDVEGHELAVLEGASGLLERAVPRLVLVELELDRCPAAPLVSFMVRFGYRAHSITDDGVLVAFEEWPVQNVAFTREGA